MLVKAVEVCGGVVEIDVSCNTISEDGLRCLAEYLKVESERSQSSDQLYAYTAEGA